MTERLDCDDKKTLKKNQVVEEGKEVWGEVKQKKRQRGSMKEKRNRWK